MARGFSSKEKQAIRLSLIQQGRELFRKFGFQKTNILDITKNVGIAQGTFYKFFNSKEELYFVILEIEEQKLREQFAVADIFTEKDPKQSIKNILQQMIEMIEENSLIRELFIGDTMTHIVKKLSPELLEKHYQNDSFAIEPLLEKLRKEGFIIEQEPQMIASILRSFFLLTLHKKEIGESVFDETMEVFIDLIIDGLIKEGE
ncbi:TetR/AcrR family transcriptional regulator [Pseudogracilibacillus sp. SO30301A]|uniref:TetR/AcrR family transcriptional regulator n=1 Tax=Pseudogracilibacillus sp. SO30301A TaxID=3098291 RepID=UPI00300E61A9